MKFIANNKEYMTLEDVEKGLNLKRTAIDVKIRHGEFPKPEKFFIRNAWEASKVEPFFVKKTKKE